MRGQCVHKIDAKCKYKKIKKQKIYILCEHLWLAADIACVFIRYEERRDLRKCGENVELSLLFRNYTKYHMIMLLYIEYG